MCLLVCLCVFVLVDLLCACCVLVVVILFVCCFFRCLLILFVVLNDLIDSSSNFRLLVRVTLALHFEALLVTVTLALHF